MKRFAVSTVLAGGLFAGLLGMAGAAHADLVRVHPTPAFVTRAACSGIAFS